MSGASVSLPRRFAGLVKLEHTVFALPFAYVGMLLAVGDVPRLHDWVWVTLAMVGARTLAMTLNRLIDAELDARNPRTAARELPAGLVSRSQAFALALVALALFLLAVFQLDPVVRWLWPAPVVLFVVYPYLKRFTWLCHLWLGASLGLAPVGAWLAVSGDAPWEAWAIGAGVALWVAGFDLFYSLFDVDHDRAEGLASWAVRFGERGVFAGARVFHVAAVALFALAGLGLDVGVAYWIGVAVTAVLLALGALARPAGRPPSSRRRVLHRERRDQHRVLRLRARRRARSMISATALEKRYGRKRALRPVDFAVAPGELVLVTGANGSGKTTLLRLLAGLAAPSRGDLAIDVDRGRLGYLAHEPLVYRDLTGVENLDLYGRLYRVPERRERVGMLLERFGLWEARNERSGAYSRGMLQRLALCRTLLHDPDLLVLDEPYTALDAEGSVLLDGQLEELIGERTVVLSTHDPARVEALATQRLALA